MCVTKSGTSTAVVLKYLGFMCMTKGGTSTVSVVEPFALDPYILDSRRNTGVTSGLLPQKEMIAH